MKSIPNLLLAQICPPAAGLLNFNTCHDPDCGNFGVEAGFGLRALLGSSAGSHGSSFGSNA